MPPAVAAYIGREVCRALAYVHDLCDQDGHPLSIVHRDVTPSNVVLTHGGGVKLLDFGVAKFRCSESMTRAGTVRGKPAYLAPEQIEERPIDRRVDLFSLGVVVHEMLSLEHLFAGDSDVVTVRKVLEMEIPRPSSRCAGVPDALDAIVMKALERDRGRRYQNAAEMARDLDEIVVASGLRIEEIVAFIASVEADLREAQLRAVSLMRAESARSPLAARASHRGSASTARDRGRGRAASGPSRRRRAGAALAGVALVAAVLAAAFGLHVNVTKNVARAATPVPVECSSDPG
jgi:serine/threonine-protein kinase